jgi:DNA-binding response OmpR family regulator
MYRILIIEDDFSMAHTMERQIQSWGNQVHIVENFQNIMEEFEGYHPQLVLLDIMLPFYNGYHWCSEIRRRSNVPVVFLSSASDNMNIVMAMNMGGDDFIAKPVDLDVMMAKIQAVLRRTYDMSGDVPTLEHCGAVLNLNDTTLEYQGERIELTKNEYRILQTLMENKGKIVSRDTLMTRLWQMDSYVEENTLTVNVNRLRKKLEQAGLCDFIKTKVGSGYIIL